jgi:hypothetical protein
VSDSGHQRTTPSDADGDGVRVVRETATALSKSVLLTALAAMVIVAGIAYLAMSPAASPTATGRPAEPRGSEPSAASNLSAVDPAPRALRSAPRVSRPPAMQAMDSSPGPDDLPSGDPNDLATYVSPSDPEPTAAEVIQALHDIGDHTGIGAFNPPGTSPPLRGLAVPDDFVLPDGYVRHHQVTDEGDPLEPILMFSPDVTFVDASGRAVPIPESRVVPPDMAPPGFPIREIAIAPQP